MLWLKIVGGVVVLAVVYVLVMGNLAERSHVVAMTIALKRPPAELFAAVADHASQPKWRADVKAVELLPPQDGHVVFRETTAMGPVRYVVDEAVDGRRYVTRILDEDLGYRGRWIFDLAPDGAGTRVTITEEGEVTSLFFRALSPFFSKSATIDAYLRALAAKSGETAVPELVRKS